MAKAARVLLYVLLVWAPVPFGSTLPIFWAINGAVAVLALVVFVFAETTSGARRDIDWRPAAWAAAAFVVVAVWMVAQALPGVPVPFRHPVWAKLAGSPDATAASISVSPGATWTTIAEVVPIGLLAIVAMRLSVDRRRADTLLRLVVATTTAVAAYGLVCLAFGLPQVLFVRYNAYPGFVTGTFVGRNAAAMYFVVGIATATALAATRLERIVAGGRKESGSWSLAGFDFVRQTGFYLVADFVLVAALLDTGSRGGAIAGGVALLVVALLSLRRARGDRRPLAAGFAAVFGAVVVVVAIASDLLVNRLQVGATDEDRLLAYRDTLDMIGARPLLGHGAGTFIDAFPMYSTRADTSAIWNAAHDSYLQAAAELGLPAFTVLVAAILIVLATIFRAAGRTDVPRPAAVAALAVAAGAAFHSIVDFSLQIQAVGLTAAVLIGAGLGESVASYGRAPDGDEPEPHIAKTIGQRTTINVTIPTIQTARSGPRSDI